MAKSKKKDPVPKYVNDPSLQALSDILLWKNRNKNFMDRVVNPGDKPSIQTNKLPGLQDQNIPDDVNSTHLMAHDLDRFSGKGRVYPMLVQKNPNEGLEYLNPVDAYSYADKSGEYVETPSHPLAEYFSKQGYKMASDNLYGTNYKQYMKYEDGGPTPKDPVKSFYERYIQSPKYKERLIKGGYPTPDLTIKDRLRNVTKARVTYDTKKSSQYETEGDRINIDPTETVDDKIVPLETLKAHEYGHAAGAVANSDYAFPVSKTEAMNQRDINEIYSRNRLSGQSDQYLNSLPVRQMMKRLHDRKPSESKADLDTLRYHLYKDKIYDAGTQDFNLDHLNKARGKYRENPDVKRLFDYFSDDDLLWMMNNVAKNDTNNTQPVAENGKFMKIRPKYFNYEDLPAALAGMYMEPGPKMPGLKRAITDYYGDQWPESDLPPSQVQGPAQIGTPPNTSKVQPGKFLTAKELQPQQPPREQGNFNPGNAALLAMSAFDALLPNRVSKQTVVQPQMAYNPNPYGQGSQALMNYGGMMPSHGHQYDPWLTQFPLEPVPMVGQQQSQEWMYKNGGIIPDNMSNFSPQDYANGGGVDPVPKGKATRSDSLALYNNAKQVADYYNSKKNSEGQNKYYTDEFRTGAAATASSFDENNRMANERMKGAGYKAAINKSTVAESIKPEDYRRQIDSNRYYQRENQNGILDLRAPMTLFDKRIDPQFLKLLSNRDRKDPLYNDEVQLYQYDPVAVKPWDMLTPQEREIRVRKYGTSQQKAEAAYKPTERNLKSSTVKGGGRNRTSPNIPEPGYSPTEFNFKTNYSATYPDGNQQRSAYFPNQEAWQSFVDSNSSLVSDSQVSQGGKRGSATLKNRPMEYGGNIRQVGADYPNTDLLEQWLICENGGTLSADKAKEMLKDGKANGKKLTKKQKQYFGMVAAGKAAFGTEMPLTEDPIPKVKAGVIPKDTSINWNSRNIKNNQIDKDALLADRIGELLGNAYDPYQGAGRAILGGLNNSAPDPQFVNDLGVRLKSIQSDPTYQKMTPEQRIMRFYQNAGNNKGASSLDQFINRASSLGGNPAAFWQNNAANMNRPTPTINFKDGGVMYDDGGQINTMWGGNAELESYNPYDGGTVEFNGASHDDGGIGMQYNGNPIEVEGGEYASKDGEGNLHIYGNMFIPGSKTKFKKAAKAIADKEKRYDFLKTKGSDLVNNSNPANKYDQLKFNAGKVMMQGGQMGQQDLASKKETLASLQKSMLEMAGEHGLDPFEMSKGKMKKAKKGASIPYAENGDPGGNDPTRADRNMNPGNIKYGKFAQKYGAKRDKDGFAIFPDRQTGQKAMQDLLTSPAYNNMSAKEAIRKWTGGNPYRYDLGPITDKKIGEMDPDELSIVMGTMTKGEGTRYGVAPRPIPKTPTNTPTPKIPTFTPYQIPDVPLTTPVPGATPVNPGAPYDKLDVPTRQPIPSDVEGLGLNNTLGEIYAAATNKVEPVPAQRYEPQLFTPYQVSFQDRLNANQSVFNAQQRAVGASNPAALGTLGAQKYAADQQVFGDEFRTNQSIASDITNKNIALVNDANLKNLGIADTQMVRQSQAKSKTRELNQMILNSLSDKYAKNSLENKRLAAYENLYDYRFVPQDDGGLQATYFGPNAMFNYQGKGTNQKPQDVRTITRYDAQGNRKGYAEYDESDLREMQRILDIQTKKSKLPLIPLQPLK